MSALSGHRRRCERTQCRDDVCLSESTERSVSVAESAVSATRGVSALSTQSAPFDRSHCVGCATLRTVVHYFAHICDVLLLGGRDRTPGGCVRTVHCCGATQVRCLRGRVLCLSTILSRVSTDVGAWVREHRRLAGGGVRGVVAVSCRHPPPMCPRCAVVGWRTTSHLALSQIALSRAPSALCLSPPTICVDVDRALSARTTR